MCSGLRGPHICLHCSGVQGARPLLPPAVPLSIAGPAGSARPDLSVSLEYVMTMSWSCIYCVPSVWHCLSPLRYKTPRNSLDIHACTTQKHVGVGARGSINLTNSIQDEDELFSVSLPHLQRLVYRGKRIIWPLGRLPTRPCGHLVTKLWSAWEYLSFTVLSYLTHYPFIFSLSCL